jgi:hypothetical protein
VGTWSLRGTEIVTVPLASDQGLKVVDPSLYAEAECSSAGSRAAGAGPATPAIGTAAAPASRAGQQEDPHGERDAAIASAAVGLSTARLVTPATVTSSPTLTETLLTGSGGC